MTPEIDLDLKTVCLTLLLVFLCFMILLTLTFIKALFKFPSLRAGVWHGITDGDGTPNHNDFQRAAQLFWGAVFGTGLVVSFLLWAAFPGPEWRYITSGIAIVFLASIGLRSLSKSNSNGL